MNSQSRKLRDPFVINNITMAAATATLKATKPNSKIFVPHPFNRLMTQCNNSCTNHSTKESVLRLRGGGTEGENGPCCEEDCPSSSKTLCQSCGHNVCLVDSTNVQGYIVCGHCVQVLGCSQHEMEESQHSNPVDMTEKAELLSLLESKFGHANFRSKEQENAVMTLIEGKHDLFVTMPTGRFLVCNIM